MQKAIVLGAGLVGSVMAADMAADPGFTVTVADARHDALAVAKQKAHGNLQTIEADLSDPAVLRRIVEPFDIVLGSLSSRIAFKALRTIIEARKNYADIAFMAEDPLTLDEFARENGVTCVVDCGVAPGMSHMIAGAESAAMETCENIEIYVGGLPRERRWPFEYKAPFSPSDVIEEYTRPSRLVEHGRVVTREALSEPELMDFPGIGTLEAFNTDGLRSLIHTLNVPFMKEKTLRYPGHIELMRVLRHMGLFGHEKFEVGGVAVRPIEVTAKLMFPKWKFEPHEEDVTVMRVIVEGTRQGRKSRVVWDLFDRYHAPTASTSMSRTTAFPCTIMARMLASGEFARPGVIVPEIAAQTPGVLDHVVAEQAKRGIGYVRREGE